MYYNQNYLTHYGVKGMKWGVRRYQNADGSLTDAGKKKMGIVSRTGKKPNLYRKPSGELDSQYELSKKQKQKGRSIQGDNKPNHAPKVKGELDSNYKANAKIHTKSRRQSEDISKMSDAELRAKINRMQMERQYKKLKSEDIGKGREVAKKILKTGTTVATVTSTGLTIYNNVERIRNILDI